MSLSAPWYLLGLCALALPWLLHRFGEQRPAVRRVASDRFLEAVPPPVSERRRLRHRALFAMRWLAIALLCLLFAQPVIDLFDDGDEPRRQHLVVIDASFSMRAGDAFASALERLDDYLSELPADATVRLYRLDGGLVSLQDDAIAPSVARDRLAGLEPGWGRGDAGTLMRGLDAIAARGDLPSVAVFATDAQASAMPLRTNELFAPSLSELRVERVDDTSGGPAFPNVRVDADASASNGSQVTLGVNVRVDDTDAMAVGSTDGDPADAPGDVPAGSAGGTPSGTLAGTLEIRHADEVLAREPVELRAGRTLQRSLAPITLPAVEMPTLEVRFIEVDGRTDALTEDDAATVAIDRSEALRITLADAGARLHPSAEVFLRTAFETADRVDIDRPSGASARLPDDADLAVVALDPVAPLPRTVEDALADGIDVLAIPGSSADAGASSASTADGAGAPADDSDRIARIDRSHPLALGEIDWHGVRRFGAARFETGPDDRVLLATGDGAALLIERAVAGRGRLLLLDDPLDGDASSLPFEPAFVELIDVLVDWFDAAGALPDSLRVGEAAVLPSAARLLGPDGETLVGERFADTASAGDTRRFVPERPGLYRVFDAGGEHRIAVTTDPRESALAPVDAMALENWTARHTVPPSTDDAASPDLADALARRPASQSEPWRWLLPVLALLIIGESMLANRRLNVRRD